MLDASKEFEQDFDRVIGEIRSLAAKHGLPVPSLVLNFKWMGPVSNINFGSVIQDKNRAGVRVAFGRIEHETVTFIR